MTPKQPKDIILKCGRTLAAVLDLHAAWLLDEDSGQRAVLTGAVLTGAVLTEAVLTGAVLKGANLRGADLTGAVLTEAVLTGADLTGADLKGANLRGADLTGAVLTGAVLTTNVAVADIDAAILDAIGRDGCSLDMDRWHSCETTHCRAGWAIKLAGDAGRVLEDLLGPNAAAALIYAASGSHPVPNWFTSDDEAMDDMRRRAGVHIDQ